MIVKYSFPFCGLHFHFINSVLFKKKKFTYLFIWQRWVLVAAHGIFTAACGIFSCGMWDLVP